jgi:hypothetical protein
MNPPGPKDTDNQNNQEFTNNPSQPTTAAPTQTPTPNSPIQQSQTNTPNTPTAPSTTEPIPNTQITNNPDLNTQSQTTQPTTPSQGKPIGGKKGGALTILITIAFLVAIGFIGYSIYIQTLSGVIEYESTPLVFTSKEVSDTKSLQLTPENNPYRPQVTLKYKKSDGISIGRETLASYNLVINDPSKQPTYQESSSFSYRESSDDSGSKSVTTSTNMKDFQVENVDEYQLVFSASQPEGLDSDFALESIQFRLRSQVKNAPAWVLIVGALSLVLAIALIIIKKRKAKKEIPQTQI